MRKNRELAKELESSHEEDVSSGSEENSVERMINKVKKTQKVRQMKLKNFKQLRPKDTSAPKRVYYLSKQESDKDDDSDSVRMPKQQDIGTMELQILTTREITSKNRIYRVDREISQVRSVTEQVNSQDNKSSPDYMTVVPVKRTSFGLDNPYPENTEESNIIPNYHPIKLRDDLSQQKLSVRKEVSFVDDNAAVIFRKNNPKKKEMTSSQVHKPYSEHSEELKREANSVNTYTEHRNQSEYSTPMVSERTKKKTKGDLIQAGNTKRRGSHAQEWIKLHRPSLKQHLDKLEDPSHVELSARGSRFKSSDQEDDSSPAVFRNTSGHQSAHSGRSSGNNLTDARQTDRITEQQHYAKDRVYKLNNSSSATRTFDKISGTVTALEDISQWRANVERDKQGFFQRIAARSGVLKQREREEKTKLLREQQQLKQKQQKQLKWAGFADDQEFSAGPRREMKGEAAKGRHLCNNCKYCVQLQKSNAVGSGIVGEDFQNDEYDEWTKTEQFLQENFGDYGYIFMLRAMVPIANYSKGCAVPIPETIIFKDGISKVHLSYLSDETKIFRPKEPYTSTTIRKIFVDKDYQTQKGLAVDLQALASTVTNSKALPTNLFSLASVGISASPSGQGSKITHNLTEMLELQTNTEAKPAISNTKTDQIQDDVNDSAEKDIATIMRPFCVILLSPDLIPRNVTYPEFTKITELRKTHRFWSELRMIQSCKLYKHAALAVTRVRFDVAAVDAELLLRAEKDMHIREGRVPVFAKAFVSQQEEAKLLAELKSLSKIVYCRYLCCKLFAYISLTNRIQLNKFMAEFYEDEQGTFWFCNVRIIQIVFQDLEESIQHIHPKKHDNEKVAQADSQQKALPNVEEIQRKELALKRKEEQKRQLLLEMELIMESRHKSLFSFKKNISKMLPFVTPNFELDKNKKLGKFCI